MKTNLPIQEVNIEEVLQLDLIKDKEQRTKVKNTAFKLIDLKALNRVLDKLDQDQRDELSNTINNKESEDVIEFLNSKGIDFIEITKEETKNVQKKLADVIDEYNPNV